MKMGKEIMKTFLNFLQKYNIILISLGFLIVAYIIYARIKISKKSITLQVFIDRYHIIFFGILSCIFFITMVFLLYYILIDLEIIKPRESHWFNYKYSLRVKDLYEYYYIGSLIEFDKFLSFKLFPIWPKNLNKLFIWSIENIGLYKIHWYVYIFDFLPKIIISITFLFDIFYFKEMHYFYFFGVILLIPLFFKYLMYKLKFSYDVNLEEHPFMMTDANTNQVLTPQLFFRELTFSMLKHPSSYAMLFQPANLINTIHNRLIVQFSEKFLKENKDHLSTLDEEGVKRVYINALYFWLQFLIGSLSIYMAFNICEMMYQKKIQLFCCTCFFIGWLYMLFYGLGYFS